MENEHFKELTSVLCAQCVRVCGGGGGGRLTRFATRIPTLQPESLLYNHRHCFRCQNPHFTTANRENAHFATRLLRVFVRLSACLRCYDFAIASRAVVEGCGLYATSSVYNHIWGSSIGFTIHVSVFETMSTLVRNGSVHEARC